MIFIAGRQDDISKRVAVIRKSSADRALGQEDVRPEDPATTPARQESPCSLRLCTSHAGPREGQRAIRARSCGEPGRRPMRSGPGPRTRGPRRLWQGHSCWRRKAYPSRSREGTRGALLTHLIKERRERGSQLDRDVGARDGGGGVFGWKQVQHVCVSMEMIQEGERTEEPGGSLAE